jgi:hypothetical protein
MTRRRAIDAARDVVASQVGVIEDHRYGPPWGRSWILSCGQLVDAVIDDSQLLRLAHHLEQGCSLELSLARVLDPV